MFNAPADLAFDEARMHKVDLRVHFGLNTATKIDSAEIRWPSGKIETLKNLDADNFYSVLEGQGIVAAEKIRPSASVKP